MGLYQFKVSQPQGLQLCVDYVKKVQFLSSCLLTHVVGISDNDVSFSPIGAMNFFTFSSVDLNGHNLLLNLPLGYVKTAVQVMNHACVHSMSPTALFLLPKGTHFAKCMQNMQLLGEFDPTQVYVSDKSGYNGLSVKLPKKIQLFLWTQKLTEYCMHNMCVDWLFVTLLPCL